MDNEDLTKKHIAIYEHTHSVLTTLASKDESYADVLERLLMTNFDYDRALAKLLYERNRIKPIQ